MNDFIFAVLVYCKVTFVTFHQCLLNLVFYTCMRKLFFCLSFIVLVGFCSCENYQAQAFHASLSGQVYVSDTMLYKDHSYILVRNSMTQDFQVLHSPDCFCRYNRKFIVVKHSK